MRQVYLDNNATTPLDPAVVDAMIQFLRKDFGNASSVHRVGQKARAAVEAARQEVALLIEAQTKEIVFTSGGTEADNLAIRGCASFYRDRGNHIITSKMEHPAVLKTCEVLESEGFDVTYLNCNAEGTISLDELRETIRSDTLLISIMQANNETGAIQPLGEICSLAKEKGILVHTDAVQAVGKVPVSVKALGVDLLSLSAHKFHGPKGSGALYIREGIEVKPMSLGGSHERGRRGGTENVAGIFGLGEACRQARIKLESFSGAVGALRDRLENSVLKEVDDTVVNGSVGNRAPHVSNLSFGQVQGEALLVALDFNGVAVSTGAACSSGSISPSHVLTAMGLPLERINGAIRFSLGRMTDAADIDYTVGVLKESIRRIREASPNSPDRNV
jgi:cysteine desulfurase